MVRIAAATISALPLGTWASTLRRKCTRQRCQAAPSSTAGDRLLQPGVGVGDDQLHPAQPAGLQRAQERGPERAVLGVADGEPEHLPPAVGADPGGHHDGLGDHPPVDPGLAVGGVEEHVGERAARPGYRSRKAPTSASRSAQIRRHLGLGDAGVRAERLDQVVDLPRADAVQVGLHHHREQRLIDPPPPLQQRREERPGAQLRDPLIGAIGWQAGGGRPAVDHSQCPQIALHDSGPRVVRRTDVVESATTLRPQWT